MQIARSNWFLKIWLIVGKCAHFGLIEEEISPTLRGVTRHLNLYLIPGQHSHSAQLLLRIGVAEPAGSQWSSAVKAKCLSETSRQVGVKVFHSSHCMSRDSIESLTLL